MIQTAPLALDAEIMQIAQARSQAGELYTGG